MRAVRAAVAAVTFLTRVPLGRFVATDAQDVARAAPLFPVVGAAVGAAGAGVALLLQPPLSPLLAAAIAVAATVALTGAFHLDGLADALDATGGMTRERPGVLTGRLGLLGAPVGAAIALAALGVDGLVVLGAAAAAATVLAFVFRAWLGGMTGDTLGATSETVELLALVVAAALV